MSTSAELHTRTTRVTAAENGRVDAGLVAILKNRGSIEVVPIDDLNFDAEYQRDLRSHFVEKLVNNYSELALGFPLVSRRDDGSLYVVNGQHRTAAAKMMGHTEIIAFVVEGLTQQQEASLRLVGNVQLGESNLERFKAKIAAGDETAIAVRRIIEGFGSQVNTTPMVNVGLNAVSTLEHLYNVDGGDLLTRSLSLIRDAWGEIGGASTTAPILKGVAWMLHAHSDSFDRDRMVELLRVRGRAGLQQMALTIRASMGGALWTSYYRALVDTYNQGLSERARLRWQTGGWSKFGDSNLGYSGGWQ